MSDEAPRHGQYGASLRATRRPEGIEPDAPAIGDWLQIEDDGTVVVFTGKVEVGQHIRTSLAQAVAEELRVPLERVRLVMADTDLTPYDMGTVGSRTTPITSMRLRRVAASLRELLRDMVAEFLDAEHADLEVADGRVLHRPSGRARTFAELAGGRRLSQHYDEQAPITPPEHWTVAGTAVAPLHGVQIVTGALRSTPDLTAPGMLAGAVLRPPSYGATLTALETSTLPAGVTVVREGDFVGVVATDRAAALRARDALRAEWAERELPSNDELWNYLRTNPAPPDPALRWPLLHEQGDVQAGLAGAALRLERSYSVAYIAHAPLEPRAALAEWNDGRLTVWTGTQRPFAERAALAEALGVNEDAVRVIVPDTGSGYGGKNIGDAALEAARLARAVGAPVKLVWTREDEFTAAYLRPAGVIDVAAGLAADGTLLAWEFHNYNSGAAAMRTPYDVPHQRIEFHPVVPALRQGSYRALAATANTFAREVFMDELATLAGADPLAFRLSHLGDARLRAVLTAAAERFGWDAWQRTPGRGRGIAGGVEKGSYVATCAEVALDGASGRLRVVRVVQAFECGAIINPAGVESQVEGAIVQGLGGALFEAVAFERGRITSDRFSKYRVPRFADMPPIEIVLLDRRDLPPAGAGETPIIGIAPALANAIFDATGVRLRELPLVPGGHMPGGWPGG
jgi:nicotinate dehydrogenase subunit B